MKMELNYNKNKVNPLDLISFSGLKRVPIILQSEVAECGLACIAMVSSYYGNKVNLASLRQKKNVSSQGMALNEMMEVASTLNLSSRAVQCEIDEVELLSLPCVLHWSLDHFVVLTGRTKNSVYINDPASGKRKVTMAEFNKCFTGIALEFSPTSDFTKKDARVVMGINQLWSKIIGIKSSLLALFFVSIVIQSTQIISPYYIQWVIDKVLLNSDRALLVVMVFGFSLLALIQVIIKALRSWIIIRLNSVMNIQIGSNLFHHLIRLPMSYFEKRHIGDIVTRFGSMNAIRDFLTTGIIEAVIDGIMSAIILVLMYLYSPWLTFLVICFVIISFLIQIIFYLPNRQFTEESIIADAREHSNFLETIRGIQTIKLFGYETIRQNNWLNKYADIINTDIKLGKVKITESSLDGFIISLEYILIVYFGAIYVMTGDLSVGMLLAFISYKTQFTNSTMSLIDKIMTFKLIGLHLERISDIALTQAEKDENTTYFSGPVEGYMRVRNLSFRYSDNTDWVFKNVSFEVRTGECVAIVGPSGCGKSTILKLMLGILKPNHGDIFIDNKNIGEISMNEYRKALGCVMQNDNLFSGTIAENITMFNLINYDEEKLRNCCEMACIWSDIKKLPMGIHTQVGEMGNIFSGGQLQRIFLARALYKEPKILFLDESTSHLDLSNELKINENIKKLQMTKIIIAHRKETIDSADRVIFIDDENNTTSIV